MPFSGLAYTAPFRVLSDEGVRALRRVIDDNEKFATSVPHRIPKCLRGLGYRSNFVRDLNYSPELLRHLAACSGLPGLAPHGMGMNLSQTNFGQIGTGAKVDQWHIDSVPYVLVILLSDATDMEGGDLQVARVDGASPEEVLNMVKANKVPPEFIDTAKYPGPGYAIFMQGSRIAHGVTPVVSAHEPRLTVVNSYQTLNPFDPDKTVYRTFKTMDGEAAPFEFARHAAWRARGQLDYLLRSNLFGKEKAIQRLLHGAQAELLRARDLISGRAVEDYPYDSEGDQAKEAAKAGAKSAAEECGQGPTGKEERGGGGGRGGGATLVSKL